MGRPEAWVAGIFALAIPAVIVTFVAFSIAWAIRAQRAQQRLKAQYPDAPWMWRSEWATGQVTHNMRGSALALLFFACFWNAISLPASYLAWAGPKAIPEIWPRLFILLFPLVGMALLYAAVRGLLQWRKYGNSCFRLAEVPGVIGGKISGVVEVPATVQPTDGYHLTLQCVHRVVTGSGKNQHTNETVLWETQRTMLRGIEGGTGEQTTIPVAFAIPFDARESNETDHRDSIVWRLKVAAATPGVDYDATFDVPVFRTEASSPDFVLDESGLAGYAAPEETPR